MIKTHRVLIVAQILIGILEKFQEDSVDSRVPSASSLAGPSRSGTEHCTSEVAVEAPEVAVEAFCSPYAMPWWHDVWSWVTEHQSVHVLRIGLSALEKAIVVRVADIYQFDGLLVMDFGFKTNVCEIDVYGINKSIHRISFL